jgi:arsenite methyltransferase
MSESTKNMDADAVREKVRDGYAAVARQEVGCCGGSQTKGATEFSKSIGYSEEELAALPEGANLGAGCGNPTAEAEIRPGDVVLDLGSGAGIDCFLAARKVGPEGRVIGVDMTDEMLDKARKNARKVGARNVEFRKGLIEELPVADRSVDLIISNCVINLSPQKDRVFAEAFRVLKPGGKMLVSDIVLEKDLPPEVAEDIGAYVGCIAGAVRRDVYMQAVRDAGFSSVEVLSAVNYGGGCGEGDGSLAEAAKRLGIDWQVVKPYVSDVVSLKLRATKAG